MLGGPLAIPWSRLFESSLNFVFEVDYAKGTVWIRNKAPAQGEKAVYVPSAQPNSEETFAVIAAIPNLRRTGQLLLFAGATTDGTEAAGDMILQDELPADLQRVLSQATGQGHTVELLLRIHAIAGVARDSKLEAYRVSPSGSLP
jgi:hypothetical protein